MGAFDDLIPETAAPSKAGGGGTFDDLVPPSREKELRTQYLKDQLTSGEPGYSQRLKDSATLGLMRPISGVMHGITGLADPTSTFGERYRAGVGAEEDYAKRAVENTNPILGAVTDVAGSVGGAPVAAGRAGLAKLVGQSAATGAVEGAARNAEDPGKAAAGAATGAAVGGATSAAVGGAAKLLPGVQGAEKAADKARRGADPQELKGTAKGMYQQLDNAGIAYGQPQTASLKQGLDDLVANNQYNPIAHQKISGYVDQLDKLAQNPAGAKFTELHNLRSALATEARGSDPSTRTAAGKVIGEIDKMVQSSAPVINPNNVDIKSAYPEASRLWKAASLAEDTGYAADKAARKASSKAGINPDEANRGAFRAIEERVSKPGAYDPYTSDQRELLSRIVQGDKGQNALRFGGKVASDPLTKTAITGIGGYLGHGIDPGLGTSIGAGTGYGASQLLEKATRGFNRAAASRGSENIDALLRNITGSSARAPSREALAILMAKQRAQRAGAAYGSSLTGE